MISEDITIEMLHDSDSLHVDFRTGFDEDGGHWDQFWGVVNFEIDIAECQYVDSSDTCHSECHSTCRTCNGAGSDDCESCYAGNDLVDSSCEAKKEGWNLA